MTRTNKVVFVFLDRYWETLRLRNYVEGKKVEETQR